MRYPMSKGGPFNNRPDCPNNETESCESSVPCPGPVNCEYVWTKWSNCDCSEGEGKRTRNQTITVSADHNGEECPVYDEEDKKESCKCPEEAGSGGAVGAVVVVLLIIILATGGGGGYFFYKKRTNRHVITVESDHQVLAKDDKLKDKLNELTEDPEVLFREFQQLETEVANTFPEKVLGEMNQPHNRYCNIGE